jgi:hypothetical protein
MNETMYPNSGLDGAATSTITLAAFATDTSTSERNRHRVAGFAIAATASLGIWAAIAYGVWDVVHAMS